MDIMDIMDDMTKKSGRLGRWEEKTVIIDFPVDKTGS